MASQVQFDLNDESGRMLDELRASRAGFMKASRAYSGDHELDGAVAHLLANYYDPEKQRAVLIQQAALDVTHEIKGFVSTFEKLAIHYAAAVHAAEAGAMARLEQSLAGAAEALRVEVDERGPRDAVRRVFEGLDLAEQKNALLLAQGIVVGRWLALAMQVGADLLLRRQDELQRYRDNAPPGVPRTFGKALFEEVITEGVWTFCEVALGEVVRTTVGMVPVVNIIVGVANIALEVRKKVDSLQSRYDRGEIDRMFDLCQEMQVEREAMEGVVKLFDTVMHLSALELELGS